MLSKSIAAVLGPTLAFAASSEALTLHIWADVDPTHVYFNGLVLTVAGLAIVRFHNRWARDWTVLVTLSGWLILAAGLFRLYRPEAPPAEPTPATYAFLAALFVLGLVLTIVSWRRD